MQLLDRTLEVLLIQNYGVAGPDINSIDGTNTITETIQDYQGYSIDISDYVVELGEAGFECDTTNLTVASMQSFEVKCIDNATSDTWNFIQANLNSPIGLLPPYLKVSLGGIVKYYGLVDLSNCSRTTSEKEFLINIPSQDWYTLASQVQCPTNYWTRVGPVASVSPITEETQLGLNSISTTSIYDNAATIYFSSSDPWLAPGDNVTVSQPNFLVIAVPGSGAGLPDLNSDGPGGGSHQ